MARDLLSFRRSRPHETQWSICFWMIIALIGLNFIDGLGMIFWDVRATSAPEFLFLNGVLSLNIQGIFLLALTALHTYGVWARNIGLELSFILGASFYSLWAFGVLFSQLATGEGQWGTLSKATFVCVIYLLLIKHSPHPHPIY